MPAPLIAAAAKKVAEVAAAKAKAKLEEKAGSKVVGMLGRHRGRGVMWAAMAVPVSMLAAVTLFVGAFGAIAPPAAAAGSCAAGQAVPSSADIPPYTMERINALKADYEAVGAETNIGWNLFAAIDFRENSNSPDRSMLGGEIIGTKALDSNRTPMTKRESIQMGAETLRGSAQAVYGVNLTPTSGGDDVKKAIIAYGRYSAYKTAGMAPDASPYVMNLYDAAHTDMVYPSIKGETLAGDTERRLGAYTLFTRLGGSSGNCGMSDTEIVRIAQQQLGLREVPDGCNCGEQLQKFLGSSSGEFWCADFVSWVYREAGHPFTGGLDGGWRIANVEAMHNFVAAHGTWWPAGSAEDPKPGDVISFRDDEHVGLVESLDDAGTPGNPNDDIVHTIEGNTSNMVARRTYARVGGTIAGWGRQAA